MNTENNNSSFRIGRVEIDDNGICQKAVLFFFGEPFDLQWSEIESWARSEMVVESRKNGESKVVSKVLEFHTPGKVYFITRGGNYSEFQSIEDLVNKYIPEKKTESYLTSRSD